jgi:hypothetical protein
MAAPRMGVAALGVTLAVSAALIGTIAPSGSAAAESVRPPNWVLHGRYAPKVDPANFVTRIDSRYFPLLPGTGFHYVGIRDGVRQTDDMVVTHGVKVVLGVRCTVVRDTVSEHGEPVEQTFDRYGQDKQENVWYLGELSLEKQDGRLAKASDSWEAGVDGAKPGIIIEGKPRPGDVYRQEYYPPGEALDQARVLGRGGAVTVPAGRFERPLATIEWSPVEPQLEKKYYVAGVGEVLENVVQGGHERFQLVKVTH